MDSDEAPRTGREYVDRIASEGQVVEKMAAMELAVVAAVDSLAHGVVAG